MHSLLVTFSWPYYKVKKNVSQYAIESDDNYNIYYKIH